MRSTIRSRQRAHRFACALSLATSFWFLSGPSLQELESFPTVGGSAVARAERPTPATTMLEEARTLLEAHEETAAIEVLKRLLAAYGNSDSADDAYLLMGAAHLAKKQPAEAVAVLEQLLTDFPDSPLADRARVMQGRAYAQTGNLDQALSVLAEARTNAKSLETQREALNAIGEIQRQRNDVLRAVQSWLDELMLTPQEHRADVRRQIVDLITAQTDRRLLTRLRDIYPTTFPGDVALIRLADLYLARGEQHLAEQTLRIFLNRFPTHEYAATATATLQSFTARVKSSQYVILAALPLSGQLSPFGIEVLHGIRLALDKARETPGLGSIGLIEKDLGSEKTPLRGELTPLLLEHRPIAVIGPLLSKNLQVAASLAENLQIPFITPTATMHDVRRYGSYVFSTAMTYPQQTHRIVDYAVGRLGLQRFCILYPDSPYGRELARLFAEEARARGAQIIAVDSYKEHDTDFTAPITRLKAEDLQHDGEMTEMDLEKGGTRTVYTPGFDAIFLPGDSRQVAQIAPQLAFHDITVPLLGSNGWHSPDLLRYGERTLEGSTFVDAFYAGSTDASMRDFVDRYRRRYQTAPSIFAAQAYDATRLVTDAIRRGATSGDAVRDHLVQFSDLPSIGGPAGFGPSGTLERHVFLIQVKNGRFVLLD